MNTFDKAYLDSQSMDMSIYIYIYFPKSIFSLQEMSRMTRQILFTGTAAQDCVRALGSPLTGDSKMY